MRSTQRALKGSSRQVKLFHSTWSAQRMPFEQQRHMPQHSNKVLTQEMDNSQNLKSFRQPSYTQKYSSKGGKENKPKS